jgi:hypothetical protein
VAKGAESIQVEATGEGLGLVVVEAHQLVGDEREIGGLGSAYLGAGTERLGVRTGLWPQRPTDGSGVHRNYPTVAEDRHRCLVRVVDPDHDKAMTGDILGQGGEEKRWKAARREQQHGEALRSENRLGFRHGVAAQAGDVEPQELCRR